jgi:hypothetical protein
MNTSQEDQDIETAVARSLGRSFARQRLRDNLIAIAILLAAALVLIAIRFVLAQSYDLVVALQLILPWVLYGCLARQGPGGVFISWMWSSIACYFLTMGYFGYATLVDRTDAVAAACILGAGLIAGIAVHRPEMVAKGVRQLTFLIYCFTAVYSYNALLQLNCLLDRSPVTIYRPIVLEKVYGIRRSVGLLVESWSPDQRHNAASVLLVKPGAAMVPPSPELFKTAREGETICVLQRKGALGMSWYTAQSRSWTGGPLALGPWGATF